MSAEAVRTAFGRSPRTAATALIVSLVAMAYVWPLVDGTAGLGAADLLLRVVALDAEDLFRINGKILACDGVERTDTALAMGELIPFRIQPLLDRNSAED